jgi:hypothetical protein
MPKSTFLLAVLLLAGTLQTASAQKTDLFIGGNLIVGFPSGDFKDGYKRATGIEGSLGLGGSRVIVLGTLGYMSYKEQSGNPYGKITVIPVKAGLRVYPTKLLFLTGNAGVGFLKDEVMSSRETRFVYDAGIGLHLIVAQISLHYDAWKRQNTNGYTGAVLLKFGIAIK